MKTSRTKTITALVVALVLVSCARGVFAGSRTQGDVRQSPSTGNANPEASGRDQKKPQKLTDADKIKNRIISIGVGARITVVLRQNSNEYYGAVSAINDDTFVLSDIDLNREVTIRYSDVKKIVSGFGNPNPFNGKRWHPAWHIVAIAAAVGATVALIAVAATVRD
ncbi:MAG TPA: hypothetical protein VKM94_21075 [Blastocatellia bacterium]|nr:hypothetical protein [Blastocatellia bacterium]